MDNFESNEKSPANSRESSTSPNDLNDSIGKDLSHLRSGSLDSGLSQSSHETTISRDTTHGSARRLQLPQILLESDFNSKMVISVQYEADLSSSELSQTYYLSTCNSSASSTSPSNSCTDASLSDTLTNASPSNTASTTSLSHENLHRDCAYPTSSYSYQTASGLNDSNSHLSLSPEEPNSSAHFRVGSQRVVSTTQPESSSLTSIFKRY